MNIISTSLLQVDPYPHTFTSKLKPVNCVEKDNIEFEITTEAADAEVTWFNGNKKIVADGERIVEVVEVKQFIDMQCFISSLCSLSGNKEEADYQQC